MTKRIKVSLLIVLAAVCVCACALAGCKIGEPHGSELTKGYDVKITYYANGGRFNSSNNYIPVELYVKNDPADENYNADGVPFMDIRESGTRYTVRYDVAHVFGGWYEAKTYPAGHAHEGEVMFVADFDGKEEAVFPKYDEKGFAVYDVNDGRPAYSREGVDETVLERNVRVVASDVEVTSARRVKAEEPLVVCAVWKPALKVVYLLKTENGTEYTDENGAKYGDGDEIGYGYFSGASLAPSEPKKFTDATYRASYYDAECENIIDRLQKADITIDDPEDPKYFIYAKYIDGANWTFVTNTQQSVNAMFNGLFASDNKYYIEEDIDCSAFANLSIPLRAVQNTTTNALILGNGHTISNLRFTLSTTMSGAQYSVFGNLGKDFAIYDLKLSGIKVSFNTSSVISYYALWTGMEDGATLKGFEVENITAEITLIEDVFATTKPMVSNAQQGDTTRWLFGGVESDAAFLAAHGEEEIKVGGTNTLTINDN